jgi:hypothetical protein
MNFRIGSFLGASQFAFLCILASGLFGRPASAQLLDLDRILVEDEYQAKVRPLFLAITEVQIGGSNTYGNKTIIKTPPKTKAKKTQEKLDPSILIINPDANAHAQDESVLGIQASAFDLETLAKFLKVANHFKHRFKKIYINNLGYILPIPDKVQGAFSQGDQTIFVDVSERQQKTFEEIEGCTVGDYRLEQSFFQYVLIRSLYPDRHTLYPVLAELLEEGGIFLFKSFGVPDQVIPGLDCLFIKGFTFQMESLDIEAFSRRIVRLKVKEDKDLLARIRSGLKKTGDAVYLQPNEFKHMDPTKAPTTDDSRGTIKAQVYILESGGFTDVEVGFGQFKDWRNPQNKNDAYSMIIRATKK